MLGSNELNTFGSLYAYRASKAAVNAIMKSMGIDLGKRGIIAAALHPGWVQTDMGGASADVAVTDSVSGLRNVIAGLTPDDAGAFIGYDGQRLPW
jgi:NAD(P)-dependent dehydrogenase (short-subunit alcohol dehydrogenase family)